MGCPEGGRLAWTTQSRWDRHSSRRWREHSPIWCLHGTPSVCDSRAKLTTTERQSIFSQLQWEKDECCDNDKLRCKRDRQWDIPDAVIQTTSNPLPYHISSFLCFIEGLVRADIRYVLEAFLLSWRGINGNSDTVYAPCRLTLETAKILLIQWIRIGLDEDLHD